MSINSFNKCVSLKLISNGYNGLISQKLGDIMVGYSSYDVTNTPTIACQLEGVCPATSLLAVYKTHN